MKRLTLYIAFLLLALAQAQAQVSKLTDMYATGKTLAAGFYKWKQPIVTHFRVYHTAATSSQSKGYALSFDTEDSIGGIGGEEEAIQAIYTLQGNALRHYPTRGGLYIVNGKKVLIR